MPLVHMFLEGVGLSYPVRERERRGRFDGGNGCACKKINSSKFLRVPVLVTLYTVTVYHFVYDHFSSLLLTLRNNFPFSLLFCKHFVYIYVNNVYKSL